MTLWGNVILFDIFCMHLYNFIVLDSRSIFCFVLGLAVEVFRYQRRCSAKLWCATTSAVSVEHVIFPPYNLSITPLAMILRRL